MGVRWGVNKGRSRYLSLGVCHGSPLCGGKDTLFGSFGLVAENIVDEFGVCADALEEHKVGTERFLGSVWILDVALARLAGLALGSAVGILTFDVVRGE